MASVASGAPAAMSALVRGMRYEAAGVVSLTLEPVGEAPFPAWRPGAHIDVRMPDGRARQYSLCGSPDDPSQYRVAVLREKAGSGGSEYIHDALRVGAVIDIGGPRNHFALEPAPGYVFIAGGIGITPLMPMIAEAQRTGIPWHLFYYGADRASMAFVADLEPYGDAVTVIAKSEDAPVPVVEAVAAAREDDLLYVCGPARLSGAARAEAERAGIADRMRVELFSAPERTDAGDVPADAFTVRLVDSGLELSIPADRSILEVVLEAGIDVLHDCEEGICGTCETKVVAGEPEHRDYVLTEREKQVNDCMMICVSRSRCPVLELSL